MIKKLWKAVANIFIKAWQDTKQLGWIGGSIAILIAIVIFYLPTIVTFILYIITNNVWYLGISITYVVWWFSPAFSPALIVFSALLIFVVKMIRIVQRKDNKGEIE